MAQTTRALPSGRTAATGEGQRAGKGCEAYRPKGTRLAASTRGFLPSARTVGLGPSHQRPSPHRRRRSRRRGPSRTPVLLGPRPLRTAPRTCWLRSYPASLTRGSQPQLGRTRELRLRTAHASPEQLPWPGEDGSRDSNFLHGVGRVDFSARPSRGLPRPRGSGRNRGGRGRGQAGPRPSQSAGSLRRCGVGSCSRRPFSQTPWLEWPARGTEKSYCSASLQPIQGVLFNGL